MYISKSSGVFKNEFAIVGFILNRSEYSCALCKKIPYKRFHSHLLLSNIRNMCMLNTLAFDKM